MTATGGPEFPVTLMVSESENGPYVSLVALRARLEAALDVEVEAEASVTLNMKLPAAVGTPVIMLEARVKPGGSVPAETENTKDPTPGGA